ncbi:hypothetical protein BIU82_14095 [Arthrobacter sp. SW1]|uniref:hypothetical protein n=1 Tax=Arthrobacter sp. SW1 TaxID=1920889 RepID=UPI000877C8D1|nr:hypothetical protein [Arthrobacter sp. SW1]OFI39455.1 hypothetical protein BIU82_14095 [Arthrobacter sp. SW1]
MQDDLGFYAPLQYGSQWMWLGLVLLAAVIAWLLRPARQERRAAAPGTPPADMSTLRSRYLAAIDAVVADAAAGRVPEREAHQRLSLLLRGFAGEVRGVNATHMTLAELRDHGLGAVAEGVAGMYPAEFAAATQSSVERSAALARQAVHTWN